MEGSFCLGIFIILESRVHKASESQLEIMEVVFSSMPTQIRHWVEWSFEAQTMFHHTKKNQTILVLWTIQARHDCTKTTFKNLPCLLILQTIQARNFLINSANAPTMLLIGCIAGGVRILQISLLECMEAHMVHGNKINLAGPKLMSLAD